MIVFYDKLKWFFPTILKLKNANELRFIFFLIRIGFLDQE